MQLLVDSDMMEILRLCHSSSPVSDMTALPHTPLHTWYVLIPSSTWALR